MGTGGGQLSTPLVIVGLLHSYVDTKISSVLEVFLQCNVGVVEGSFACNFENCKTHVVIRVV